MTLRDILAGRSGNVKIMERTYYPDWMTDELSEKEVTDGMLTGFCVWDGENLISADGDSYSLDEIVERHEWEEDGSLTYWVRCEWVKGAGG